MNMKLWKGFLGVGVLGGDFDGMGVLEGDFGGNIERGSWRESFGGK